MAEYQNDGNLLRKIYFAMLPVNILGAEKPVKKNDGTKIANQTPYEIIFRPLKSLHIDMKALSTAWLI